MEIVWIIIDETVVQIHMEQGYIYEDATGKDRTDIEAFKSAPSASVPFKQSDEEEKLQEKN